MKTVVLMLLISATTQAKCFKTTGMSKDIYRTTENKKLLIRMTPQEDSRFLATTEYLKDVNNNSIYEDKELVKASETEQKELLEVPCPN